MNSTTLPPMEDGYGCLSREAGPIVEAMARAMFEYEVERGADRGDWESLPEWISGPWRSLARASYAAAERLAARGVSVTRVGQAG